MDKLNNKELSQKINSFKSKNRTIMYHHSCELSYLNEYKKLVSGAHCSPWHSNRDIQKYIFNNIASIIQEEVVNKKKCV